MISKYFSRNLAASFILFLLLVVTTGLYAGAEPGVEPNRVNSPEATSASISPVIADSGLISLSVDGLGMTSTSGTIQVEKPAGATVRNAYMAAASTGFTGHRIGNGEITIAGTGVAWEMETPNSIGSYNSWADVTATVKPVVDAAPAGRVDLTIGEANEELIDGELLAVIFDDPNQTSENSVVLLFGAQEVGGDTFNIAFAEPINKGNPDLTLDLSLGISYSYQGAAVPQASMVNVNGTRMSSSAGGYDDGDAANGALFTVGGLDDSNDNPPPFAYTDDPRQDDELYSLIPFVADGDTAVTVFTVNPSQDDNILFASLFLTGEAIVGEGILLSPDGVTNPVGTPHTLTARVQDDNGAPVVGREVTFTVVSGPNAGLNGTGTTDANGEATFTYTGALPGTDLIEASFVDSQGAVQRSNQVTKIWESVNQPPVVEAGSDLVVVDEGQMATNTGTVADPDGDPVTLTASSGTVTGNPDGTWSWSFATVDGPAQSQTVTISADDGNGGVAQTSFTLTVNNVAPAVATPSVPAEPEGSAGASFSDPAGNNDEPYTCTVDYGDGSGPQPGTVSGTVCQGPEHVYTETGTYLVTVAVTDKDGGTGSATAEAQIVIPGPGAGFVTGGGWLWSEAGDCQLSPDCATTAAKATFGFVAKYKQGAQAPSGNTQFQFPAGNLNFHATGYEWLVVSGNRAQYQGTGTINGTGSYHFRVTVFDTEAGPGNAFAGDRFRIRIWIEDPATGAETVVYDNGRGSDFFGGSGDLGTDALGSGSIVIHPAKGKRALPQVVTGSSCFLPVVEAAGGASETRLMEQG